MNDEIPNEVKTAVGTFIFNEYGNPEYRCTGSQWLRKHNFIINSVTKSNIVLHEGNYYFNPRGATLINDTVQKSDIGTLVFDPNTKTVKSNCEAGKWLKENHLNPDQITIDNFKYAFKSDHWRFITPSQKSDKQENNQQQIEAQKTNNQQQNELQESNQQIEKQPEPSYEPKYNFQLQQQQLKNKIQKRKQVKKLQELLNIQQMQYIHQMRELQQLQKEYQTKQLEVLKQTQIKNQKQSELQEKLQPQPQQEEDNYESEYNDYYDTNDYNDNDENNDYYEEDEINYYENLNNEYDSTNSEYNEYGDL